MELTERLSQEALFADVSYAYHEHDLRIRPHLSAWYETPKHMWNPRERIARFLGPVTGKRLFDFGCGMGEEAMYLARMGAEVHAMDISSKGVEITKRRAAHNHLKVEARTGDVLNSGYPDGYFDLIHGIGILHHVGLEEGLREVQRLLKSGGRAAFLEHMSNSGLVDWLRARVQCRQTVSNGLRLIDATGTVTDANFQRGDGSLTDLMTKGYTDYEKPLTWGQCATTVSKYGAADLYCYSLLYRLRRLAPAFGTKPIRILDHAILSLLRPLRHYAGLVLICITKE
ncbi:MAG TPA: class I SAM-dependent methyltransferase [Bryobacteraceae bacterium]|nr:class I SAM-dependent methyltransferase [Bryobacteraceae bacterium]